MLRKITALILAVSLIITQPVFAQGVSELNIGKYLSQMPAVKTDSFRPARLRYVSYDIKADSFQLLLDKGDDFNQKTEKLKNGKTLEFPNSSTPKFQDATQELFNYFLIGLSLPNEKFWVNLRPDAPEQIIDPLLEKTDMGKIMLEADLQLKKDTAGWTSPQNPEGKEYWDKLYKKAGELFGTENITIPTITRPWIVPGEVIIRESEDSAYIYKANLKVMLEEDYLNNQKTEKPKNPALPAGRRKTDDYNFYDPRMKELNRYSTQLIKELILPRLTQEINTSKKYAQLRQVFFSLILSRWFKDRFKDKPGQYSGLIDSRNLDNLTSKEPWAKDYYFNEYKKSFQQGEYNLQEQVSTPTGQVIRSYVSGGVRPVPDNISSFVSAGTSSPIDWNLLIPIATTIGIVGILYTMLRLQARDAVASRHAEAEAKKLELIRRNIAKILQYSVAANLLAEEDAVVVKTEFKDYQSFTLEKAVTAVNNAITALKAKTELSDEVKQRARQEVIAILEKSPQALDKTTGSSPLTPEEGTSSALTKTDAVPTQMAETRGGIDFTRINYLTRPMGSFQGLDLRLPLLSKAELEGIDISREMTAVEQMVNAKIDVSTDRLKCLLAAMSQKDAFTSQRETQLLPLLLRLCWLKEEKGVDTTPDFRAVLLIADTGLFVEQGNTKYSLN